MQVKLLDIELLEAAALAAQCHGQVTWSEGGLNHFKIGELWIIDYDDDHDDDDGDDDDDDGDDDDDHDDDYDDDGDDDDAMFWDMYLHITRSILYVII